MARQTGTTVRAGRSAARAQFLGDVLITAIEHNGYGQFTSAGWNAALDGVTPQDYRATIVFHDESTEETGEPDIERKVDIDTIAAGFGVIARARVAPDPAAPDRGETCWHGSTGARLFVAPSNRARLMTAYAECDAGELDVIDALAVLECAVFGAVTYG